MVDIGLVHLLRGQTMSGNKCPERKIGEEISNVAIFFEEQGHTPKCLHHFSREIVREN